MTFTVYILECRDKSFYTGYTQDLQNRLTQHSRGQGSRYVRSRLPAKLIYTEKYKDRTEAMQREKEIKKMSRKEKENLIK